MIDDYTAAVLRGVRVLVEEYAYRLVRLAKLRVPVDTGDLRSSIKSRLTKTADKVVAAVTAGQGLPEPDLAAWVEFGTGPNVEVNDFLAGLESYAMQFYRTGKGTMQPQPYLFNSFEQIWRDFVSDVDHLAQTGEVPT
jgi:hypothetical protein